MAVKYYDFFIKGNAEVIVAYIDGYLRGRGVRGGYLFTEDLPFQSHKIKEFLKFRGELVHLICHGSLRPVIRSAIRQGSDEHKFEFVDSRSLKSAYFEFKFETANRKVAGTIKRLMRGLPPGVRIVNFNPCESQNPGAKGAEGYAPLHEYLYCGDGIVRGNVESVLKLYYRFSANDFLHCEEIDLDY
jgi:hypothetical protein